MQFQTKSMVWVLLIVGLTVVSVNAQCENQPCHNGASCAISSTDSTQYVCTCVNGWSGNTCDDNICTINGGPCLNSGNCTFVGQEAYTCTCPELFSGKNCSDSITNSAWYQALTSLQTYKDAYYAIKNWLFQAGIPITAVVVIVLVVIIIVLWRRNKELTLAHAQTGGMARAMDAALVSPGGRMTGTQLNEIVVGGASSGNTDSSVGGLLSGLSNLTTAAATLSASGSTPIPSSSTNTTSAATATPTPTPTPTPAKGAVTTRHVQRSSRRGSAGSVGAAASNRK
jgi:hypothetical protein